MSIDIYFSNSVEHLSEVLVEQVLVEIGDQGPLHAPKIIVPNPNIKKWLQLQFVEKQGISMNIQFQYLEKGMWELMRRFLRDTDRFVCLDRQQLRLMIFSSLISSKEDREGIAQSENETTAFACLGQRLQWSLAGELAGLFLEYESQRPEMMSNWRSWCRGNPIPLDATEEEREQFEIYRSVLGEGGLRSKSETLTLTPGELSDRYHGQEITGESHDESIYLFALSPLSPHYCRLLYRLGADVHIKLFLFNVCEEFWEDMSTVSEQKWVELKRGRREHLNRLSLRLGDEGEELEPAALDNTLLRLWGKPGREMVKVLSLVEDMSLEHYQFEQSWVGRERAAISGPATTLHLVQEGVRRRRDEVIERVGQDTSLQILACPSMEREVETVANSILYNISQDPSLKCHEIAVLVPDMGEYRHCIETVFAKVSKNIEEIPYVLVDSNASTSSQYGKALLSLLRLAFSSCTRKEIFELCYNPCFMSKQHLHRTQVDEWLRLSDELGIYHDIDDEASKTNGRYTWRKGLRELRLSRVFSPESNSSLGRGAYEGSFLEDQDVLDAFIDVMERLFYRLEQLVSGVRFGEWVDALLALQDEFLAIPDAYREEGDVRQLLLENLRELSSIDQYLDKDPGEIDPALFYSVISEALENIPCNRGSYLGGGVCVSSLRPVRPLPFKLVYLLGLGEGAFAAPAQPAALDLRQRARKLGDVSSAENQRYLFLETLLCVQDKLYLSYVAKDLQKDQEYQLCSVLNELVRYLEDHVLKNNNKYEICEIPLEANSPRYYLDPYSLHVNRHTPFDVFCNLNPYEQWRSAQQFYAEVQGQSPKEVEQLCERIPEGIRLMNDWNEGISLQEKEKEQALHLRIDELLDYLMNPALAWLNRRLRIGKSYASERDLLEDEPVYSPSYTKRRWLDELTEALIQRYQDGQEIDRDVADEMLNLQYQRWMDKGVTPDGEFAKRDLDTIRREWHNIIGGKDHGLLNFLELQGRETYTGTWSFGEAEVESEKQERLQPLCFRLQSDGCEREVFLHGSLEHTWISEAREQVDFLVTKEARVLAPFRESIGVWLTCLASRVALTGTEARPLEEVGEFNIHFPYRYRSKLDVRKLTYVAMSNEQIHDYFNSLLRDYLDTTRPESLPFESIVRVSDVDSPPQSLVPGDEVSEELQGQWRERFIRAFREQRVVSKGRGNVEALIDIPVPEDAFQKVQRRFYPFFTGLRS